MFYVLMPQLAMGQTASPVIAFSSQLFRNLGFGDSKPWGSGGRNPARRIPMLRTRTRTGCHQTHTPLKENPLDPKGYLRVRSGDLVSRLIIIITRVNMGYRAINLLSKSP